MNWRGRAERLYGFMVLGILLTVIIYGLQFQARSGGIESCRRVNEFRVQFNHRAATLRAYGTILIKARIGPDQIKRSDPDANRREVTTLRYLRKKVSTVPLTDCEDKFPKPWPFGAW